ncbi:MAG: hypothetical protein P3X22_007675 [Thermoprotei archaeon]|nr:hypothetical protein [Thermoprotei archaeon]
MAALIEELEAVYELLLEYREKLDRLNGNRGAPQNSYNGNPDVTAWKFQIATLETGCAKVIRHLSKGEHVQARVEACSLKSAAEAALRRWGDHYLTSHPRVLILHLIAYSSSLCGGDEVSA